MPGKANYQWQVDLWLQSPFRHIGDSPSFPRRQESTAAPLVAAGKKVDGNGPLQRFLADAS
jgi:hypothetical protein